MLRAVAVVIQKQQQLTASCGAVAKILRPAASMRHRAKGITPLDHESKSAVRQRRTAVTAKIGNRDLLRRSDFFVAVRQRHAAAARNVGAAKKKKNWQRHRVGRSHFCVLDFQAFIFPMSPLSCCCCCCFLLRSPISLPHRCYAVRNVRSLP